MPDREKVIRGLKCLSLLSQDGTCAGCAYFRPFTDDPDSGWCNRDEAIKDALVLLMEQEPVKPTKEQNLLFGNFLGWNCGACGFLFLSDYYKYCPHCGRRIKWNG